MNIKNVTNIEFLNKVVDETMFIEKNPYFKDFEIELSTIKGGYWNEDFTEETITSIDCKHIINRKLNLTIGMKIGDKNWDVFPNMKIKPNLQLLQKYDLELTEFAIKKYGL